MRLHATRGKNETAIQVNVANEQQQQQKKEKKTEAVQKEYSMMINLLQSCTCS